MRIHEYKMFEFHHQLMLPRGARFLGIRRTIGWWNLYFEHPDDWTLTQRWLLFLAHKNQVVQSETGWAPDKYHLIQMVEPTPDYPVAVFLFWRIHE